MNSQKLTSGVSQPISLFGVAGALFSVGSGAVESEGMRMKSCPEPRIEVIVKAHERFWVKVARHVPGSRCLRRKDWLAFGES